jgi:DNA-binding FadR family transcriptional regulator
MLPPLPHIPRSSLVESTIHLIRAQVEQGNWKVGERIPKEAELADMLGVSRNTVREAVRVLSHADVLDVRQGDGTYVRSSVDAAEIMRRVNRASLRDHFELRVILETETARLAATRRTKDDIKTLRKLLDVRGTSQDGDLAAFIQRDLAFHVAVSKAAHNEALDELYRYFVATAAPRMQAVIMDQDIPEPDALAHTRILQAIEDQAPERAAQAAHDAVMPVVRKLSEAISR